VDFLNSQLAAKEAELQRLQGEELRSGRDARRALQEQVAQLQDDKAQLLTQARALQDGLEAAQAERKQVGQGRRTHAGRAPR
jgi:chromosome segregation ATPase